MSATRCRLTVDATPATASLWSVFSRGFLSEHASNVHGPLGLFPGHRGLFEEVPGAGSDLPIKNSGHSRTARADVDNHGSDLQASAQKIDRRSSVYEVPHHLASDRLRVLAHAGVDDAVVAAKYVHAFSRGRGHFLPTNQRKPQGDFFKSAETARWFRQ